MIQPDHPKLSIDRQRRPASISHSTFYHASKGRAPRTWLRWQRSTASSWGDPVLRQPADDLASPRRGPPAFKREADAPADASDADLPPPADHDPGERPSTDGE